MRSLANEMHEMSAALVASVVSSTLVSSVRRSRLFDGSHPMVVCSHPQSSAMDALIILQISREQHFISITCHQKISISESFL